MWELFERLVRGRGQQLSWDWIPDSNLPEQMNKEPFSPRQCYVIVRLAEMFLRDQRVLWKKFYPMVHGFVRHKPSEFSEVAGPGQLKELGTANLDRLVGLAYPLTEPTVYNGSDLDVLVGLYAVPSSDAAKVLLGSLGQLSSLAGLSTDVALKVADVVKAGVEGLVGIEGSSLQLGVRDTLKPSPGDGGTIAGKEAKAGFLVALNARAGSVPYNQLWVYKGRLVQGADAISGKHFSDHDYMLVEIERRDTREDWRSLPEVVRHEKAFDEAIRSGGSGDDIKKRINELWRPFSLDVKRSSSLTDPDKDRVLKSVAEGLRSMVVQGEGGPFETRSTAIAANTGIELRKGFDLLNIEDIFANRTVAEITTMRAEADRSPF